MKRQRGWKRGWGLGLDWGLGHSSQAARVPGDNWGGISQAALGTVFFQPGSLGGALLEAMQARLREREKFQETWD